jgi:hypothetical protein
VIAFLADHYETTVSILREKLGFVFVGIVRKGVPAEGKRQILEKRFLSVVICEK